MKAVRVLLLATVLVFGIFVSGYADSDHEGEAAKHKKLKPAGKSPSFFEKAYKKKLAIEVVGGVDLYVLRSCEVDKGKNYEFSFNFVAKPDQHDDRDNNRDNNRHGKLSRIKLPEIKGVSLYVFSAKPEPLVQISYENSNQWISLIAYEPQAADQIIDEHGGPKAFYGLNYAWLIGSSFTDVSHDLGVVFIKTPAKNRLKFVIETYVLENGKVKVR